MDSRFGHVAAVRSRRVRPDNALRHMSGIKLLAAALTVLLVAVFAVPAGAHPTPEPRCSGETHAVVAAAGDAAMAELIASWQVLDTTCVWTPDRREALFDAIEEHNIEHVVLLGGTRAVSITVTDIEALPGDTTSERVWGVDRVETARAVLIWIDARAVAGDEPETQTQPTATRDRRIAASGNHSCAIGADGAVACWGKNDDGQTDAPAGVYTVVATGGNAFTANHSCAIRADGTVACWGSNWDGQADAPAGTFTDIAAGSSHSCAIRSDGIVVCWGRNEVGQLDAPTGTYTAIAAGSLDSCAIRADGAIACWGNNYGGGDGRTEPPAGTFTDIAVGDFLWCAIRTDGTIACWYSNRDRQLDRAAGIYTDIAAGSGHVCAIRVDGTIDCWVGINLYGQLDAPSGTFTEIAAGSNHSCALRVDGIVACWGDSAEGQTNVPNGLRAAA